MRDILLLIAFPVLLYFVFRRPFIGTSLWMWSALFFPNGWVWGLASNIRFNLIIAIVTIVSYLFQKNKLKTEISSITILVVIFFCWTTISSIITISNPDRVWHEWNLFMKIIIFYLVCITTLKTKHHLNVFLWAIVLSAAYFGAGEGLKFIITAGSHKLEGIPGSRLQDRNELAVALNASIPIAIYLYSITSNKILKIGLVCVIILNIVSIIGSSSRGGIVALIVVSGYFFLKSKRKIRVSFVMTFLVLIGSFLVSEDWLNRMNTIENMGEDASMLGRFAAWKINTLIALDNPFFGAGFKACENILVWKIYEPDLNTLDYIIDTSSYVAPFAKAAHSIYFQVLGDQGIVGFLLYIAILTSAFFKFSSANKMENLSPDLKYMSQMVQLSLIAFCAGGAALSIAYYDLLFALIALSHCIMYVSKKESEVSC
ncbi:putative O-glycosylation ligase, exosortase A system-associated [Colwellia sp. MT41]|uniref:putative O-glycosylation ligase, exosortase A system-associated n=1 Tax=Colwellia sp. MT41 TaxID=58049 RepID=UPI000A518919|nr:putative O-glycosylation ligase, exosortase A system-associated [Colwellia sp. MT41]